MALIFQRLARNFIKNGYFPTDALSIERILMRMTCEKGDTIRLLDPCCGEGTALAECANYLKELGAETLSVGIEFNEERAYHAKQILFRAIHSDIQHCEFGKGEFNCLWLNPPYGDRLTDHLMRDAQHSGRERWEKYFLSKTLPSLCVGGLLIYIIPHYVLDRNLAKQLARNLSDVAIYRLPEDQFKQIVILGYKRRSDSSEAKSDIVNRYLDIANDRNNAALLDDQVDRMFTVSGVSEKMRQKCLEIKTTLPTAKQMQEVSEMHVGLWQEFSQHFTQRPSIKRRPVRRLSQWHLALMIAAGQLSGVVKSASGRQLFIKGSTHKEKELAMDISEDDDGNITETRTEVDRFVPIIKAIDVTPGETSFGDVFTIR